MKSTFTLDPEYKNFTPGVSTLKPSTLGANGCMAVLSVANILMCLGMLIFFHVLYNSFDQEMELFRTQSAEITGQVINCEMITAKSYGSIPRLDYTYSWEGVAFQGSEAIYERNLDCAPYLNQTVAVRVVTTHPDMSRLMMKETPDSYTFNSTNDVPLRLLTVLLGGISAFFLLPLWSYWHSKRKHARLVENNSLLDGEITKVSGHTASKSNSYFVRVDYQFQSPEGELLKGRVSHHRQDLKDTTLPSAGTPVRILYADRNTYVML